MHKVSIIIVNYNTSEELAVCIRSIRQHTKNILYEIIVVDNNSKDESRKILQEEFKEVKSFFLSNNTGFSFANNFGMERSDGDYILLLNPDTYIKENSINKMVKYMESHQDVGVLGPALTDPQGGLQLPSSRFPDLKQQLFEALFFQMPLRRNTRTKAQQESLTRSIPFEVDWVSGACLLLRRNVYTEVGGLDEEFHLYNEDVEWCLRIKKAGWKIFCYPKTCVVHLKGTATHKDYFILVTSRYKSKLIYAKKHYSLLERFTLHIIVILGLLLRIVGSEFKNFSSSKERRDRRAGYFYSMLLWFGITNTSKVVRKDQ